MRFLRTADDHRGFILYRGASIQTIQPCFSFRAVQWIVRLLPECYYAARCRLCCRCGLFHC